MVKRICCILTLAVLLFLTNKTFSQGDPSLTEVWNPVPQVVTPGANNQPPSDAIVLFNGKNLNNWETADGKTPEWDIKGDVLTVKPGKGSIQTKQGFADCQLHIEWRSPEVVTGEGQGRGNSGIFFQNRYELQVLDSYNNKTYSNGQAGSIYKQSIPEVNVCNKPGEWQTYDVIFTAPRFNNDGSVKTLAYITVFQNGIVIQDHYQIKGSTKYIGPPSYEKHPFMQPLTLQEHGNPVSYRNIWIRELNTLTLFNHRDLNGWYTCLDSLGKDANPENNFKVEDSLIHIKGKYFGYLATVNSYSNYYLKVVFKWGTKKYPPREKDKRDSGILYHLAANEKDKVWPKSVECQVQEGDCGDYWMVETMADSPNQSEIKWNMKHIIRSENFENPSGEWNTIEIICNGNQSEHYVNGHLVNSASNLSVLEGKILLQSEGAEVFYKQVEMIQY
jgi:hypothetical protein